MAIGRSLQPCFENLQMVASEWKFSLQHTLDGPEPRIGGIVARCWRLVFADRDFIDDADDVFARVTARVAHHHQQRWFGTFQSSFFFKFSHGSVNRVFSLVNKASWKRP